MCLNNHILFLHKMFKQRDLKQKFLNYEKSKQNMYHNLKNGLDKQIWRYKEHI